MSPSAHVYSWATKVYYVILLGLALAQIVWVWWWATRFSSVYTHSCVLECLELALSTAQARTCKIGSVDSESDVRIGWAGILLDQCLRKGLEDRGRGKWKLVGWGGNGIVVDWGEGSSGLGGVGLWWRRRAVGLGWGSWDKGGGRRMKYSALPSPSNELCLLSLSYMLYQSAEVQPWAVEMSCKQLRCELEKGNWIRQTLYMIVVPVWCIYICKLQHSINGT